MYLGLQDPICPCCWDFKQISLSIYNGFSDCIKVTWGIIIKLVLRYLIHASLKIWPELNKKWGLRIILLLNSVDYQKQMVGMIHIYSNLTSEIIFIFAKVFMNKSLNTSLMNEPIYNSTKESFSCHSVYKKQQPDLP